MVPDGPACPKITAHVDCRMAHLYPYVPSKDKLHALQNTYDTRRYGHAPRLR